MNADKMNSSHLQTHAIFKWAHNESVLHYHSGWMLQDLPPE